MNNRISLLAIIFFLIFLSLLKPYLAYGANKISPNVEVSASVDKKTVTIGDKIKYILSVKAPKDCEIIFPDFGKNLGDFRIKDFGADKKTSRSSQTLTQWYILDTYLTGQVTIPKAIIKYKRKTGQDFSPAESQELALEVKSLLAQKGEYSDIQDIPGPLELAWPVSKLRPYFLVVLAGSAALIAVFFLKRKILSTPIVNKPASEIAYGQLEALLKKDLIRQAKIKEYYSEISDIIRRYLENRYSLKAPEMTTEEFLNNSRDSAQLSPGHKFLLREFLVACDLVKFAQYLPGDFEARSVFESAKKFVDQTREDISDANPARAGAA